MLWICHLSRPSRPVRGAKQFPWLITFHSRAHQFWVDIRICVPKRKNPSLNISEKQPVVWNLAQSTYHQLLHYFISTFLAWKKKATDLIKTSSCWEFHSFLHLHPGQRVMLDLEPFPGTFVKRWEYTLNGMPVHHMAPYTHISTWGNLT